MSDQQIGSRHGVPTCRHTCDRAALYVRCMFHEFFYGPFATEDDLVAALARLDKADPYWDYDCFCIIRGNPDAVDYVKDFEYITRSEREAIEARRRALSGPPTVPGLHGDIG